MTTRKVFDTLLEMYRDKKQLKLTKDQYEALGQAVETFGAALGQKDWNWSEN